ncbi:hypothetical protein [Dolichospermum phage Dfl-JY45]
MDLADHKKPFTSRNSFALRIVGGAAAVALGAESSVLGWTISNVALIAAAIALVTLAFDDVLRPVLPERYGRMARFGFSAAFAAMAVATVVAAFRSSAIPV